MSTKKYVENLMADLDTKMAENKKKKERNGFLYNLGSIFTGVLGVCLLFGHPWLGVPLIGGAVALQLDRKLNEKNLDASYKALLGQKEHLSNVLKDGIDIRVDTMNKRKATLNKMDASYKKQQSDYLSSKGTHQFGNMLVAGTIALAGFISNPLIALGSLACVGIKHLCDGKYQTNHATLENTIGSMNNIANDYNIGYRVIQKRNSSAAARPATASTTSRARSVSKAATPRYSREDEEAVDAYLRSLHGVGENGTNKQKRKV